MLLADLMTSTTSRRSDVIMTDKKEHPHAWVLRAIADGEPIESFEINQIGFAKWGPPWEGDQACREMALLLMAEMAEGAIKEMQS